MEPVFDHREKPPNLMEMIGASQATRLQCQVAGHSSSKGSLDFLSHKDGYVLKPVHEKDGNGEREIIFYEQVQKACDPVTRQLRDLMPPYLGTTRIQASGNDVTWIVLRNATHDFREPCVMDVKMGARTWDPLATERKRAAEEAKYRECKRDLGFCIPGFQVYKLPTGDLVKRDRGYGKSLDGRTAAAAVRDFLNADWGLSRSLLLQFLAKLTKILEWFRTQNKYRFFSSSLLLAYDAARLRRVANGRTDGDPSRTFFARDCEGESPLRDPNEEGGEPELESKDSGTWANVYMIDFAHVFPSNSGEADVNYLNGLHSLVTIFEECLKEAVFP